ncbi:MAG: hypothetical protein ACP5RI_00370 [Candidatus Micrarchaeia archaeon]
MQNRFFLLTIIFLFALSTFTFSQLGQEAGQPYINVSVGSTSNYSYLIFNSGSNSIYYQVVLPTLNNIPNSITPTVLVTPMNGTLAPDSQQVINIKVSIPSNDAPYLKWQGILQIIETSSIQNSTSGMGIVIREGIAKILTIESLPPKPVPIVIPFSGQPQLPVYQNISIIIAISIITIIIVIAMVISIMYIKRKETKLKAMKGKRKVTATNLKRIITKKKQIKKVAGKKRVAKKYSKKKSKRQR